MSYHGHICKLPWSERPMGPCPACDYERAMTAASAPMPDVPGDEIPPRQREELRAYGVTTGDAQPSVPAAGGEPSLSPETLRREHWLMDQIAALRSQFTAAADALAAAREEQHALRVALNVIDELDAFFLKPHPLDVTQYWRSSRLKYLAMRVEDVKALAARAAPGTP